RGDAWVDPPASALAVCGRGSRNAHPLRRIGQAVERQGAAGRCRRRRCTGRRSKSQGGRVSGNCGCLPLKSREFVRGGRRNVLPGPSQPPENRIILVQNKRCCRLTVATRAVVSAKDIGLRRSKQGRLPWQRKASRTTIIRSHAATSCGAPAPPLPRALPPLLPRKRSSPRLHRQRVANRPLISR